MSSARGPIFLAGLAHSGKTPLRIALDAHSNISMTRRTYMWTRFYGRFGELTRPDALERCLDAMVRDRGIRELEPDVARVAREFAEGEQSYGRLFALFHAHHAERRGKVRWGDQLGMVEAFADPIFEAYPEATIIHMIRDPRRSGSSGGVSHIGRLGWATGRWLTSAHLAERNRARYQDRYAVVRYETLAGDPEQTLRDILATLDEEFETEPLKALLDAELEVAPTDGAPVTAAFVDRYAGRDLVALGYPTGSSQHARLGPAFYLVDLPANRAAMFVWSAFGERSLTRRAQL